MGVKQFTIPTIFTAVDRYSPAVKAMVVATDRFASRTEAGMARANRAFNSMLSPLIKLKNMLRYFGFFSGFFIVMAAGGGLKIIADFEQANADLAAVLTNVTRPEMQLLAADAKRLGLTTARTATEVVGLQTELAKLGYTTPEIHNMTEAIVKGSIAMDAALDRTALLTGAMIRTFDKFTSADTPRIIDQMTLATLDTALSFEKLETMLPIVSGAANAVNVPFSRLLALLGKLSDAGIDASSSATALRNIFIDSRRRGHTYDQVLANIVKHADRLTPAFNKFGKRGAVSAVVLAGKLKEVAELDKKLQEQSGGVAESAAAKRLDTMRGNLTLLKAAYQGFIISLEDGKGPLGQAISSWLKGMRGMLLLASGTSDATAAFMSMDKKSQASAHRMLFWLKVAGWVVASLIAMKIALIAARLAWIAYSVVMGVASAVAGVSTLAMAGNTVAIGAQTVAMWLLNGGLTAVALGFRTLLARMGPIGAALYLIYSLIESFSDNWKMIEDNFKSRGILAGLDAISATILSGILKPIQEVFTLLSKIPFIGGFWDSAAKGILKIRKAMGVTLNADELATLGGNSLRNGHWSNPMMRDKMSAINPEVERMDRLLRQRSTQDFDLNGRMTLEYTAPEGMRIRSNSDSLKVIPKLGSSMGF